MEPRLVSSTFLIGTSEEKFSSNSDPYSKPVLYVLKASGRVGSIFWVTPIGRFCKFALIHVASHPSHRREGILSLLCSHSWSSHFVSHLNFFTVVLTFFDLSPRTLSSSCALVGVFSCARQDGRCEQNCARTLCIWMALHPCAFDNGVLARQTCGNIQITKDIKT